MNPQSAIAVAIFIAGSQAALARHLNVTRQLVNQWKQGRVRIDAKHVIPIEKLTGGVVQRHMLRPDIYPETK